MPKNTATSAMAVWNIPNGEMLSMTCTPAPAAAAGAREEGTDSGFGERQQVRVEAVLVRVGDAVRRAFVDDELAVLDQLRRGAAGRVDRHDLVVVAVDDQRGHVEALQGFGEAGSGE